MSIVPRIGVIGLGTTGRAVAHRLLDDGFEVTVHDRDAWTVAAMVETGARPARIPADAAEPADVVLVSVPGEAAAEEVLFDCGGVGETLRGGGVVVVTSPTGPVFVLSAAARLAAFGVHTLEAWFAGDAGRPTTTVFVGGSCEGFATAAPALGAAAERVVHVGPLGSVCALRAAVEALGRPAEGPTVDGATLPHPRTAVTAPAADGVAPGVLTLDELMDVVGTVRRRDPGRRPAPSAAAVEPRSGANCLGLGSVQFEDVITELERSCGIPLHREAVQCSTPAELVALVNRQVTSGV
ncbi:NAD(P)-binding domain-containing protein [Geodermatophilus sp. SYSU D00703]